jgi:hypothetical protein
MPRLPADQPAPGTEPTAKGQISSAAGPLP